MRAVVSALCGAVFGLGLIVSDMIDPSRVLAFLDVGSGAWDPTLAFVMIGAMLPMFAAWRIVSRRKAPVLAPTFPGPPAGGVDARLVPGAACLGLGWGLVGFCPGPALAAAGFGGWPVLLFVACMLLGMTSHDLFRTRLVRLRSAG
ncbi:MAG: DUF6691 family protein [Pseudomonadota bacterium]